MFFCEFVYDLVTTMFKNYFLNIDPWRSTAFLFNCGTKILVDLVKIDVYKKNSIYFNFSLKMF